MIMMFLVILWMMNDDDYLDHNDHNYCCMFAGILPHNYTTNMVSKYQYIMTNIRPMDIQITMTIITTITLREQEICSGHSSAEISLRRAAPESSS